MARLRRLTVLKNRIETARARTDTRQWVQDRRARTRHLIELGGLVRLAGLADLVDDDRATLLGAFLEIADQIRMGQDGDGRTPQQLSAAWRRRGLRHFDANKAAAGSGGEKEGQTEDSARE